MCGPAVPPSWVGGRASWGRCARQPLPSRPPEGAVSLTEHVQPLPPPPPPPIPKGKKAQAQAEAAPRGRAVPSTRTHAREENVGKRNQRALIRVEQTSDFRGAQEVSQRAGLEKTPRLPRLFLSPLPPVASGQRLPWRWRRCRRIYGTYGPAYSALSSRYSSRGWGRRKPGFGPQGDGLAVPSPVVSFPRKRGAPVK